MSLLPAFEIGLWNAWLLTIPLFLFIMLSGLLPRDIGRRITPVEEVKKNNKLMLVIFFFMLIYSVFLPLKPGAWFYTGFAIYLVGLIICVIAMLNIAATRPGEVFTTGVYRYSRHPIALGTLLPFVGAGIASASWLFLLLSANLAVISHFLVITEEAATAKKFGNAYIRYMERTPRWIGLPKS
jgi:protein-S-isoprenylcysteine O-methyltransferase Ste14